jgi:hypothetical protein
MLGLLFPNHSLEKCGRHRRRRTRSKHNADTACLFNSLRFVILVKYTRSLLVVLAAFGWLLTLWRAIITSVATANCDIAAASFDAEIRQEMLLVWPYPNLCVQTGSATHPASCTMGTEGSFPGGKARSGREADHSPSSSAEVENE